MRAIVLFLLWLAMALPANTKEAGTSLAANSEVAIAQAKAAMATAAAGIGARAMTDDDIEARLGTIRAVQAGLATVLANLTPRLQDLQARQAQLGPVTAVAGAPIEPAQTAQIRRDLAQKLATVTAEVQEARVLNLTADQISATLSDRLRENFAARLWAHNRSILDPSLWGAFIEALPHDLARLGQALSDEQLQVGSLSHMAAAMIVGGLALLAGVLLVGPGRVILDRLGYGRAARAGGEARLNRIVLALWLVLVATATPLLAGAILRTALIQVHAMTPDVDQLTKLLVRVTVFAAFFAALGRALLSPGRPEWRLAPVPDDVVQRLAPFPGLIGVTAALSTFVAGLNTILGASLASRVASDCLSVLLELAAVGGALAAVGRARVARMATGAEPTAAERESRLPWVVATLAAWLAIAAALVAVLLGYLALASFLMRETVWIGAILALLFLLLRLADDLFPSLLSPKAPLGNTLEAALGFSRGSMEQIGVLMSGATRLLLILLAWVAALAPFGPGAEDIFPHFPSSGFVLRLGSTPISLGAILGGVVLFLVLLAVTRGVRRWLEVRYLPKTGLDVGVRTSLAAGVTYLGAALAILAAFAYLGLSVAQIALFASALSVGIGFGLQAIIGNFVSGLILLAERPVRVGDWIALGDLEGDVRKISIRATEIEMADHSRLIVPNSELVSKTVRNITHSGAMGRVKIVLKVDGAADAAQVRDLLLVRLRAHPKVLKDPPAVVYMTDVRDGAMEFTVFAYLISPRLAYGVKSELLFQIVADLKKAGVALASPATVVNVDLGERPIEPQSSDADPTPGAEDDVRPPDRGPGSPDGPASPPAR